ncbi:hypothetical protein L1887_39877 [Cichorium endivia]|nr:hypothetical protein L1887_39877 [Cichorium endivia]
MDFVTIPFKFHFYFISYTKHPKLPIAPPWLPMPPSTHGGCPTSISSLSSHILLNILFKCQLLSFIDSQFLFTILIFKITQNLHILDYMIIQGVSSFKP